MIFLPNENTFVLSTGKRVYAYNGYLSPNLTEKGLVYGYDGYVDETSLMSLEERTEIADHFINIWEQWKNSWK